MLRRTRRQRRDSCRDRSAIGPLRRAEPLEPRLALAIGQAYASAGSVWTIVGDADPGHPDDTILVDRDPGHPGMLRATVNGVVVGTRREARVSTIRVIGGRGDDAITIDVPGNVRIRTQLYGNAGDDAIVGGDGTDEIYGGPGDDALSGGKGTDTIVGGAGNDAVNGGDGNDSLFGGDGDDSLVGGRGNDGLQGGAGDDTLRGGVGRNTLDGGPGRDGFYGTTGRDTVRRFDAGETLIGNESTNPLALVPNLDGLKSWYVAAALARWGDELGRDAWSGWWWRGGPIVMADATTGVTATSTAAPSQAGDFSGTNNQVAGVEEGDLAQTDGSHLFVLAGDGVDIVTAWPADALGLAAHVAIDGTGRGLFLHGTRLTVIAQESSWSALPVGTDTTAAPVPGWYGTWQEKVGVTVIDVADAAQPRVLEKTSLDGWFVAARAIDGRVLVVTQSALDIPAPAFVAIPPTALIPAAPAGAVEPGPVPGSVGVVPGGEPLLPVWVGGAAPDDGTRYVYEDASAYRARLEEAWNATALPRFTVTAAGRTEEGSLLTPGHAYVPIDPTDAGLLSVSSFRIDDDAPGPDAATTVAGVSGGVYASTAHLYVSAGHVGSWWDQTDAATTTNIYQFDLGDPAVPLEAMGAIPGLVLDQFSLDETDGLLRVATTDGFGDAASSGVTVLAAAGGNLQTVGSVRGLARGERISSVRFVGDLGYVSTFRQVDPLFVVDLANPARPRVVGQLKIPGFSSFLQPLDATHLLGVGRDVDPVTGRVRGLQLSIFDVADPARPRRTATTTFAGDGWESWSAALWDHRALAWFPGQGVLALPVQQSSGWDVVSSLVVFKVDPATAAGFVKLGEIAHDDAVERSLRIGGFLYSISAGEVQAHELGNPGRRVAGVKLSAPVPQVIYAI